jgi:hypothetical protein
VLAQTKTYHFSAFLWVKQLFMQTTDLTGAASPVAKTLVNLEVDSKNDFN